MVNCSLAAKHELTCQPIVEERRRAKADNTSRYDAYLPLAAGKTARIDDRSNATCTTTQNKFMH